MIVIMTCITGRNYYTVSMDKQVAYSQASSLYF